MLRIIKELIGYPIYVTEGEIGRVRDFFFDADDWVVRYAVVDTSAGLPQQQILLSVTVLQRQGEEEALRVSLSHEQIQQSPAIDTTLPLSRRGEAELQAYYGWPAYWTAPGEASRSSPDMGRADFSENVTKGNPGAFPEDDGSNLRSLREVMGYNLQARDGQIGHVQDFIFDDNSWTLQYMIVDTGGWLPGKQVLLAPSWVERISWTTLEVEVDLTRETVKNSPEYDSTTALNRDYETRLYDHYNRPRYWR